MRFLVKDLGLVSKLNHIEMAEGFVDGMDPSDTERDPSRGIVLAKYTCAMCEVVCVTKFCTGCTVARYCSAGCQRQHWKSGGHKEACRELQRLAVDRTTSSSAAGPSQP